MSTTTPNYNLGIPSHGDTNYVETLTSTITDIDTALSTIVESITTNIDTTTQTTLTGILKGTGTNISTAVAGTDYFVPGSALNGLTVGSRYGANGSNSFAQGYVCEASGSYSHAEGYLTMARGNYSHAEGNGTITDGIHSHAEGGGTIAYGICSHAEGEGSIAQGFSQLAIGRYNIAQGVSDSRVATDDAFIIGNGTSLVNRSNAFKVTFDGKTWTQDNFYVGASNYEVYHAGNLTPLKVTSVPASATATGTAGQVAYDTNYFYVCVATDTWCRYAKSSWE